MINLGVVDQYCHCILAALNYLIGTYLCTVFQLVHDHSQVDNAIPDLKNMPYLCILHK